MLHSFGDWSPRVHETAFIAASAQVIGDVTIGEESSIWFQTVIRGDIDSITIGKRTNVQDLCVLHVKYQESPVVLGDDITIGHHVVLHGCTIEDRALIGIGSIVLDRAVIGEDSVVAAGAVVAPGTVIPPRSLVLGTPARVQREVRQKDLDLAREARERYVMIRGRYLEAQKAGQSL